MLSRKSQKAYFLMGLLLFCVGHFCFATPDTQKCQGPMAELNTQLVQKASRAGVPYDKSQELLGSRYRRQFVSLITAHEWVTELLPPDFFKEVASGLQDPFYATDSRFFWQTWVTTLWSWIRAHRIDKLELGRYRLLDDTIKLLDIELPESIRRIFLPSLKAFPALRGVGPIRGIGEYKRRRKEFSSPRLDNGLRRAIIDTALDLGLAGKNLPPAINRRQLRSFVYSTTQDTKVRELREKLLNEFTGSPQWTNLVLSGKRSSIAFSDAVSEWADSRGVRHRLVREHFIDFCEKLLVGNIPDPVTPKQVKEKLLGDLIRILRDLEKTVSDKIPPAKAASAETVPKAKAPTVDSRVEKKRPPARLKRREKRRTHPGRKPEPRPKKKTDGALVVRPEDLPVEPAPALSHETATGVFPIENPAQIELSSQDTHTSRFFQTGEVGNAPWSRYSPMVETRLRTLAKISSFKDLKHVFGSTLERYFYKNQKYYGYHSVRVDSQFRLIFRWENNRAVDVRIEDYHGE